MKECEYCGQIINSDEGEAWQHCNCPAARARQKKEDQIIMAHDNIDELFGPEAAEEYGYQPVPDYILVLLKSCATLAGDSGIKSTIVLGGALGTAKISLGSKGQIKVTRTLARGMTLETE